MQNKSKIHGFTLIELLVVMSIIAILVSLSAFGLQQARESARDGQRKADLQTIRTGLAFYKADCNAYPINAGTNFSSIYTTTFGSTCGGTNTYIQKVPSDPIPGRNYWYYSDGITYKICAGLESSVTADSVCTSAPVADCGTSVICSYSVINP